MASLTNVLGNLRAIISKRNDDNGYPLDWSRSALKSQLDQSCPTAANLKEWNRKCQLRASRRRDCHSLEQLCREVVTNLTNACEKMSTLRTWAGGSMSLDDVTTCYGVQYTFLSNRHLIMLALSDIMNAFQNFTRVKTDARLRMDHRDVVLLYLQKAYELKLALLQILSHHENQSNSEFYEEEYSYLMATGLRDFIFDDENDYKKMENPTISGVIVHTREMASELLPEYPERPFYDPNTGPYGRPLQINDDLWSNYSYHLLRRDTFTYQNSSENSMMDLSL